MKTNFKGTKGKTYLERHPFRKGEIIVNSQKSEICRINEANFEFQEEAEENGRLIIDAFNVRQQINFDLPELLKQRNEMLEFLSSLHTKISNGNVSVYNNEGGNITDNIGFKIEQLIKEVKP